jgi:FAD/FMN-containing dehydrogenase
MLPPLFFQYNDTCRKSIIGKSLPMIDLTKLSEAFSGDIITPNDEAYDQASTVFVRKGSPAAVLQPKTTEDVQVAVRFAHESGSLVSVKSGGHHGVGFGTNDDGIVIDMSNFNSVDVIDVENGHVRIGTGALWGDVVKSLETHGLAISSGDTLTVGVGGLTLGGGIGWMVRKYGLAIDSLVAAQIVTANGDVLNVSSDENADLFWAIRGGGGNFGIVTYFEFNAHPIGKVYAGSISFALESVDRLLKGWRDAMREAPDELTTMFLVMPPFGDNPAMVMITVCYSNDDKAAAERAIAPLEAIGVPLNKTISRKPYSEVLEVAHPPKGVDIVVRNAFIDDFSDQAIEAVAGLYATGSGPIVQIRSLGGASARIANDETAYAHRNAEVLIVSPSFLPLEATDAVREAILKPWSNVAQYSSGSYLNLLSTATDDDIRSVYPEATYARLAIAKARYDPDDMFSQNYNIRPAK